MKRVLLSLILTYIFTLAKGQKSLTTPLSLGDKVPDISLGEIVNHSNKRITFPSLKGKLVILDFWSITCSSCIRAMPKLDSLQSKFGNRIQVILVTRNTKEETDRLFKRLTAIKLPALPMVVNDDKLRKLFPHNTVPHHVWIDSSGKVKYITDGYNATVENISAVLNGKNLKLRLKQEFEDFDETKPLWLEGNGRLFSNLQFYSYFMSRIESYGGGLISFQKDSIVGTIGIKFVNQPILELYKIAFNRSPVGPFNTDNRIALEVKNKQPFIYPEDGNGKEEWLTENLKCYEIRISFDRKDELYILMQQDLNRFFPYTARIEKRRLKCLVLVRTSENDLICSKGGKVFQTKKKGVLSIRNKTIMGSLIPSLAYPNLNLATPIIDGTNYQGNIDIDISANLNDIHALRKELKKFDLDLIEKDAEIEMLVIKDK